MIDVSIVTIALPQIQSSIRGSISTLQWIGGGYVLSLSSVLLLAGTLADRLGHKKIFIIGMAGFGIFSFLCGMSNTAELLITFRIFQGFFASVLTTTAMSIITSVFVEHKERASAIGIYGAASGVSLGLAAPLGGVLLKFFSWGSVFFVNIPIVVLAIVLSIIYIPESKKGGKDAKWDVPGQVLIILFLFTLVFTLIELPTFGVLSKNFLFLSILTLLWLILFIFVENNKKNPMLKLQYFKSVRFSCASILAILGFSIFNGFLFINSIFLQNVKHMTPLEAGLMTLPLAVVSFVTTPIAGKMVGNAGTKKPLLICGFGMLIANVVALFVIQSPNMYIMFLVYCALGLGFGMLNAPIMTTAVNALPTSESGIAAGIINSSKNIGNCLGVALLGVISTLGTLNPQNASGNTLVKAMIPCYIMFAIFSVLIIALTLLSSSSKNSNLTNLQSS